MEEKAKVDDTKTARKDEAWQAKQKAQDEAEAAAGARKRKHK